MRLLNFLNKTRQELRYSQNQKLKVEISLSHLIGLEKSATISGLINGLGEKKSPEVKNTESPTLKIDYPEKSASAVRNTTVRHTAKQPLTVKNLPQSESPSTLTLEFIKSKWDGFIDLVMTEKALIFGPFLNTVEVSDLQGNNLEIISSNSHAPGIVENDKPYIAKKTLEYFGKKLNFVVKPGLDTGKEEKHLKITKEIDRSDDPYVNAIITGLGGEILE